MAALVLPMSNDLTVNEESTDSTANLAGPSRLGSSRAVAFLGRERVFHQTQPVQTDRGFSSIESFRSKLQFADRVFKSRHWPQKHMKKWDELYAQTCWSAPICRSRTIPRCS